MANALGTASNPGQLLKNSSTVHNLPNKLQFEQVCFR